MNISEAVYTIKMIFPTLSVHYIDGSKVATVTIVDDYVHIAYIIQRTPDKLIFNTAQCNYDKFEKVLELFNVHEVSSNIAEVIVEIT